MYVLVVLVAVPSEGCIHCACLHKLNNVVSVHTLILCYNIHVLQHYCCLTIVLTEVNLLYGFGAVD